MTMLYGFELLSEQNILEISSQARLYRHARTGAELLALSNDDENKTFGVAFCISPEDDTGVAHILEHCMLVGSGSRKYPVKELFIELQKGSLATFINGFMHCDKVVYPCASRNLQDFYNLMDVYLDAVFHPRLNRHTFQQEGWHYELESMDAPLTYRGIVFSEVKVGDALADERLSVESGRVLFPDTVYGRNVGGDPRYIPDLTYEQLKAFYTAHYHPVNARFLLYGDLPLEECLRRVDETLQEFDSAPASPGISLQPCFSAPQAVTAFYSVDEDDNHKDYVRISWALADSSDPVRTLAFEVLYEALLGSLAAPLRQALLDSGLGEAVDGLTGGFRPGLSSQFLLRQSTFAAGLKRVASEDASRVEPLILQTLETLADKGLASEMLEAAFNTVEFRLRENNMTGWLSGQRGIALMLRSLSTWIHGDDPLALLAFESPLWAVKARWASEPRYFEELIRTYLLENPHRVTLHLLPDPGLRQRKEAEERERLIQAREAMSSAELQTILEKTRELRQLQPTPNTPEALATLPTLKLSELEREVQRIPLEILEEAQTRVLYHPLPTNGIIYLDLGFDLRSLSQDDLPYAAVFGRALLEMGTQTQDSAQLAQRISKFTGGIQPETLASEARGATPGPVWLFLRGKATADKASDMLSILRDVLLGVDLDNRERFRQIVLREKEQREANMLYGSQTVARRLCAHFSESDWANDMLKNLGSLFFLRQLAQEVESNWPAVLLRLKAVHAALVNRNAMLANITLGTSDLPDFRPALAAFLAELPIGPVDRPQWMLPKLAANEGFIIPSQVNYVGKGANLLKLGYSLHGSVLAIIRYLHSTWIWDKIRVQGNAYGAYASFDHLSGMLTYLSNYDPNLLGTLDVYDDTGDFLRRIELDNNELEKNIIGAVGEMDKYQLPDAQGFTSMARYLSGDDDESRQNLREELLSTTPAHFTAFADVLDAVRREGHVVIMAAAERLREANEQRGGKWLTVTRAL